MAATAPPRPQAPAKRKPRKRRRKQVSDTESSDEESSDSSSEEEAVVAAPVAKGKEKETESDDEDDDSDSDSDSDASSTSSSSSSGSSSSSSPPPQSKPSLPLPTHTPRPRRTSLSPTPPPRTIPSFIPPPPLSTPAATTGQSDAMDVDADDEDEEDGEDAQEGRKTDWATRSADDRRAAFRKVWLGKVVEAFGGELEEMREASDILPFLYLNIQPFTACVVRFAGRLTLFALAVGLQADPTLTSSKLKLLIDSLASGIDVFQDPLLARAQGGADRGKGKGVDEVGVVLGSKRRR